MSMCGSISILSVTLQYVALVGSRPIGRCTGVASVKQVARNKEIACLARNSHMVVYRGEKTKFQKEKEDDFSV